MSIATMSPIRRPVYYAESDGLPMAENTKQFNCITLIKEGLEIVFANRPDVFAAGDLFWYPEEGNNRICTAPDVMVVFGRPKGDRGAYLQWLEDNIAPQVVFEILSPSNRPEEMRLKQNWYERHGVEEFYVYDPETIALEGCRRQGERLVRIPQIQGWTSPRLGVRMQVSDTTLELFGPDGQRFLSALELDQERRQTQARNVELNAELATARTQAAADRARADLLAAKLCELGVDPASL